MTIRLRAILTVVTIALVIIILGIGSGIVFSKASLEKTLEENMSAMAYLADNFISTEIFLLKTKAARTANLLERMPEAEWPRVLDEQLALADEFVAYTIFSREEIVLFSGDNPAPGEFISTNYFRRALGGEMVFSTTLPDAEGNLAIYVSVPLQGGVLAATLPGMFFSHLVGRFKIWETGHIFIVDQEGYVLANTRSAWVLGRYNFINFSKTDNRYRKIADVIRKATLGESGIGKFSIDNAERLCVYRPVTGSINGWALGVIAPLEETPMNDIVHILFIVSLVCIILSLVAALFASKAIEMPYRQIEELKESAESASEAKSSFLANMSHEMRTPLNAIIGLTELSLGVDNVNGEVHENLEKVYNSGVTLLGIINDILDISKIESGKFDLTPVEYDMPSLINDTVTLNIVRIGSRNISFNLHIDESLPSRLFGDELRVKQIFNNLLSNAFKYTREGRVDWSVEYEREGEHVWLVSSVRDTGIGIRPEDIGKLFTDYHQVDAKSNRKIEGTGLGLSITKRMVEMMNGSIRVESEYGKGSVFTVRICQGFVNDVPIGPGVAESLSNMRYSDHKRDRSSRLLRAHIPYASVLVVDDVMTNLDVARGMMKPYGMKVDIATSGPAAIELIRKGDIKYNAIFMDHMMPGMDGIEATRLIREIGTEYARNVPIIALTANALAGNEKMFLQNNFQDFLSKPIDIIRMDAVINRWVRDRNLEAAFKKNMEQKEPEKTETLAPVLVSIEGLDFSGALERFGDDRGIYFDIIKSYVQNTPALLEQLVGYAEEDIAAYRVLVHGIKSSSRSIGAGIVGTEAEALEQAAREGNLDFIMEHNADFVKKARELINELSGILRNYEAKKPRKAEPDSKTLAVLREACSNYDISVIDKTMEDLEAFEYESRSDLVLWLREQINASEFQMVDERLSS
ncbi:MAG: response regulator [Treponema sp.]|jgi:signal transduction histidine kinase/CheY-like chemotaxis protein|nr:response regulator [Treponema sp.]